MRWIFKFAPLVMLLAAGTACEDDDLGFTGTFDLTLTETEDECDQSLNVLFSRVDISGNAQDITLSFGDAGALTGGLNQTNFFEVSGNVVVPVPVDDDIVDVESFIEIIYEVSGQGRRLDIEEGSSQTFVGTHPAAPGVTCSVEFVGFGQRVD